MLTPVSRRLARRAAAFAASSVALVAVAGCDVSEDANLERGRALFQQKCGTCHALAEAGTATTVGPDLDASFAEARRDGGFDNDTIEGVVQAQISNPRQIEEGIPDYDKVFMPADLVTGQDAEDVATYVASVAGVPGAAPPDLGTPQEAFTELCGSCHVLAAAGTAGTTGPNLDEALVGKDGAYIEEQIVNPDSEITQGFSAGIMPQDFGTRLGSDLQGMVEYLLQSVGE